jgi:hypothetical protein
MQQEPELLKEFSDRGLDYKYILMSQWAALYEVTSDEDDDFICYDVFRFAELRPTTDNQFALYPDDDSFVFGKEVDSFSGYKAAQKDLLEEAIIRFKTLAYLM